MKKKALLLVLSVIMVFSMSVTAELAPFSVHRMTRFKVETYSPGSFSNLLLLCPTDH